jgi:hypothetical protein
MSNTISPFIDGGRSQPETIASINADEKNIREYDNSARSLKPGALSGEKNIHLETGENQGAMERKAETGNEESGSASRNGSNELGDMDQTGNQSHHYANKPIKGKLAQLRTGPLDQAEGHVIDPTESPEQSPADTDFSQDSPENPERQRSPVSEDTDAVSPESPTSDNVLQNKGMTDEEILMHESAQKIQRVLRGHSSRRLALFTPLWIKYPEPEGADGWFYSKSSARIKSVKELQSQPEYLDYLDLLQVVLEQGIPALPTKIKATGERPYAFAKKRAEILKELITFCTNMSVEYLREGFTQHAGFMLSAIDAICCMCDKANICRDCAGLHLWALDELAKMRYMEQNMRECLALLNKALEILQTSATVVGRLPYVLLQSHRACALSGNSYLCIYMYVYVCMYSSRSTVHVLCQVVT